MRRPVEIEDPAAIVGRFAGKRVAVLGDVVVDEYLYGQTDRISREAPVLIVRHESTGRVLGGAANAAANLASLGARAVAIGAIGDDEAGRALGALCADAGIEARFVVVPGSHTETKTRILAGGINTTRQQMLRLDRGRTAPLSEEAVAALVSSLRSIAAEVDVLLVSDYGSGVLCPEVISEVCRLASQGVKVCVDSRYNLGAFTGVFLAKPNEPELAAATGLPVGTAEASLHAGKVLQRALGCEAVLVTRGRSGMTLLESGQAPDLIPVHGQEEAVDVTGAGDTVIATLSLAVAAGASLSSASRLANVAGGLVVRKPGTAVLTPDELLRELCA
ncbi:bifunctional heptose 7-phosphate kinase/heptose 1-phosphate adenyltransferase [Vulgatibacter incomptus]|uniref:ADP-heptose synthase n=1 Tax=Vulgatibacter incomptus TaxID=1391653 RepID=A0A0K1PAR9_9BACT|nr:bifunctional ADP-heptose synthase [Vulgatibacter incomptus]AKU90620.1 ADP-heptose synthase [Vulgatibacter incomptus]